MDDKIFEEKMEEINEKINLYEEKIAKCQETLSNPTSLLKNPLGDCKNLSEIQDQHRRAKEFFHQITDCN
jgi:hypothetical protein